MDTVGALVVASYRHTELGRFHPLRVVLGELGTAPSVSRLRIAPLSEEAIAVLAAPYEADAAELYRTTGGNPFFATEVLAAGAEEIPSTVRDAVLARAARLGPASRHVLEAVAVVPPQAELWLLEALAGQSVGHLEECVASGMLTATPRAVVFRHELARLAVEDSVPPDRRLALPDGKKSFCIYEAPTPEAIRKAASRNDLPIDRITQVRVLDPYYYH